jgi:hypothetical protein
MGRSKSKKQANKKAREEKQNESPVKSSFQHEHQHRHQSPKAQQNKRKKLRFRCLNTEVRNTQDFSITPDERKGERDLAKVAAKRAWRTCKSITTVQIQNVETGRTFQFQSEEWKTKGGKNKFKQ